VQQSEIDILVILAQRGNHAAYSELVKYYHPALLRYAIRHCNDHELAKDAVQEMWISTGKSMRRMTDPRAFRSWLFQSLRWRIADLARKQTKEELITEESINEASDYAVSSGLLTAIKQLPKIEQEVVYLFYLEQMTLAEVAIIQSVPSGTVKSRLNRARNKLKTLYKIEE
jgi:RNA polymerase sigma-70 factor (ECF subfamily)